jgi:GDPmannose 4,6-dehydratase
MKKALITGITGQCGSYLAEILLNEGYEVYGMVRRISHPNTENINHILDRISFLYHGDMIDGDSINNIVKRVEPDEIYNLAAMSQVRVSYDTPTSVFDINTLGLVRIIEAVRRNQFDCKIYQQSSSEMFGMVQETPQKETTPFYPRSPYGISKVASHFVARTYREAYNMKIYTGILFNNESPRRGIEFLSRKVCVGIAEIVRGKRDKITLGNLDAKRDWGYSKEYMEWVHKIMQHTHPDEFILATNETHSVKEFVTEAFAYAGISNWEDYVDFDKNLLRAAEVNILQGDYTRANVILGYEPKVRFKELVHIMMEAELNK